MVITWNPSDKDSSITLSNGNLTATSSITGYRGVRATDSKSSGKWYWEIRIDVIQYHCMGIGTSSAPTSDYLGKTVYGYAYWYDGRKAHSNSFVSYGDSYNVGDIIGFALDLDDGKVWFSKNGVWQASGDPAAGTNPAYIDISGIFFPMQAESGNGAVVTARFSSDDFSYTPPTGFVSLEYVPPSYYFSGHIFEQDNPVSRKLYLYERPTGALVTTTTSSGNGYYYMETASSGSHNIVCLDDDLGVKYNDIIKGNIFPTTISG